MTGPLAGIFYVSLCFAFGTFIFLEVTLLPFLIVWCRSGTTEKKVVDSMTSELMQGMIKEFFANEHFKSMTSDEYRELARAISATSEQAYTNGFALSSQIARSLSEINFNDEKNKILQAIASESTNIMKILFENLSNSIENTEIKEKIAVAKKEFAIQENDINKESKSLNKFAADLEKFMEKYIKKDKDKISTKLKNNEIKDAIQKGFNDYFDS